MPSWTFSSNSHGSSHATTHAVSSGSNGSNGSHGGGTDAKNLTAEQKLESQRRAEVARRRKLQEQQGSPKKKPSKIQQVRDVRPGLICNSSTVFRLY